MIDLDETDVGLSVVPKRLRKQAVPKVVESSFGRNEQSSPVHSPQISARHQNLRTMNLGRSVQALA